MTRLLLTQSKQALLESNRQRVLDVKRQSEQNKQELADFIQLQREEESKARYLEKKEQEEKEAYRQYQQEVAVASMRAFISRQRDSKNESLSKVKDDLRAMKHAHQVFEGSLRKNEAHMEKLAAPRAESKKRRLDSYVKDVPIDNFQTGKAYTDALKLTSAIYFSPCDTGSLLPQTKKQVGALTKTTIGPSNGKRQIKASQVISTLQEAYWKFQRWRPDGVSSTDLVSTLRRFKLGAPAAQLERLVAEFGIESADSLEVNDFVETGVAIFTIVAPDVLVMGAEGHRRSKSAEPLHGKKALMDLERSCVSSLGSNSGISFVKSAAIKDDLTLHLAGSLKSRKAREREMAMLAQEALEIKKVREARKAQAAPSSSAQQGSNPASLAQEAPRSGALSVGNTGGDNTGPPISTEPRILVALSESPAPSGGFMGPSPAPGLPSHAGGQEQEQTSASLPAHTEFGSAAIKKGPFAFKKAGAGSAASSLSTFSSAKRQGALQEEPTATNLARPATGSTSRPVTRGSRPSSRQTPIPAEPIPAEMIPTETLQAVKEGLMPLTTSGPTPPAVDIAGMSRVQRMKYLREQQQIADAATASTADGGGAPATDDTQAVPVPIAEPSMFPRNKTRGNRPF